MDEIRLCIIGAGGHASRHIYPNLHVLEGTAVLANCDLDEGRARRIAAPFAIPRSYVDYRGMLEAERPDGVIVCVGPGFHARVSCELMEAGFHVYTEKPNAETLEQSARALEVSRRTGRICMVGYKKRFAPPYVRAKEIISGEEFGGPSLLNVYRTKGHNPERDDPNEPYLLPWGCHALDLLHFLFGPVERVHALTAEGTTESYAVAVGFRNGAVGTLALSNRPGGDIVEETTAVGRGRMRVVVERSLDMTAFRDGRSVAEYRPEFATGAYDGEDVQGFTGELREFVAAIREGREPESGIASATHTMAIYDAVSRSAASGEAAEVEET
jgi:predicted dehydrogenase